MKDSLRSATRPIKSRSRRRTGGQSEDVDFRLVAAPNFAEEARTLLEAPLKTAAKTIHPEDDIAVRESTPCIDEVAPASDAIDIIILPQSSTSLSAAPLCDEPASNHKENCLVVPLPPLLPSLTNLEAEAQIEVFKKEKLISVKSLSHIFEVMHLLKGGDNVDA